MRLRAIPACLTLCALGCASSGVPNPTGDPVRDVQVDAVRLGKSPVARWGPDPQRYVSWHSHTNRLVPVYTYGTRGAGPGIDLDSFVGVSSVYRDEESLRLLYGRVPTSTVAPDADYGDQTQLAALQRAAIAAGRRHVIVFVFDGMDWDTERAAAIAKAGEVRYARGPGSGLHFQDYDAAGTAQFGFVVTSPAHDRAHGEADSQQVLDAAEGPFGGYDPVLGGIDPWTPGTDLDYLTGRPSGERVRHAVTDSAASATAICAGVKTYNGAINVDPAGRQLSTVAHEAQRRGFAVGVVTSVPLSHATPACAYAHNVTRDDYQDLTRDLVGLPSVSHPDSPLPGMDVVIGCGDGAEAAEDTDQGRNFVPGNRYVTAADLASIDVTHGGAYVVARRRPGVDGGIAIAAAAADAAKTDRRLFAMYGGGNSAEHLPYATANGDFRPVGGLHDAEVYSASDIVENPTLAEMTAAALTVLSARGRSFWLMVEAGDVDWANHDANLDDSIGAVLSGDAAVHVATDWVESHGGWSESVLIVTADHGHYLVIEDPGGLIEPAP